MKFMHDIWIKSGFAFVMLLFSVVVGASESVSVVQPEEYTSIWYGMGFVVTLGVLPSLMNITVFYKDKSDLMLSFAAVAVPVLMLFAFAIFGGSNLTTTEQYLVAVPVLLITATLWLRVLWASCQANGSVFKGLLVVPAKIILALFWVFLLSGAMLGDTRKSRRSFAFLMALFTPLLYLLINGKAVRRAMTASPSESE